MNKIEAAMKMLAKDALLDTGEIAAASWAYASKNLPSLGCFPIPLYPRGGE